MSKRTCKWPACTSDKHEARGYCAKHYLRAWRIKDFSEPWAYWRPKSRTKNLGNWATKRAYQTQKGRSCIWPHCSKSSYSRQFCSSHYAIAYSEGNFKNPWKNMVNFECVSCGDLFTRDTRQRKYCTPECGHKFRYRNNVEAAKAYTRQWQKNNPDRARMIRKRRKALLKNATVEVFCFDDVKAKSRDMCYLCGDHIDYSLEYPHKRSPSLDHVVPLSKGGDHSLENCEMTHLECNLEKGTKILDLAAE